MYYSKLFTLALVVIGIPFSLVMSSACVLPLDIHATARDSSTPIGTATTTSRSAARISYPRISLQ